MEWEIEEKRVNTSMRWKWLGQGNNQVWLVLSSYQTAERDGPGKMKEERPRLRRALAWGSHSSFRAESGTASPGSGFPGGGFKRLLPGRPLPLLAHSAYVCHQRPQNLALTRGRA